MIISLDLTLKPLPAKNSDAARKDEAKTWVEKH